MTCTGWTTRILAAWEEGTLVPGGNPSEPPPDDAAPRLHGTLAEPPRVEPIGRGETFSAWALHRAAGPSLTIRIPWRDAERQGAAMIAEFDALRRVPTGIGPEPIAVHPEVRTSPIGTPYLVTAYRPGRALLPQDWTPGHLELHARMIAALHRPGLDPAPDAPPRAPSWWEETGTLLDGALRDIGSGPGSDPHRLRPILEAARRHCERAAPRIDGIGSWTLCHGDLCATNIVWDGEECSYIDFEWARTDDPARDLAIIGGSVHGGPWYVPMDEAAVSGLVGTYREEAGRLGGEAEEAGALRERMHDWTVYERTSMLVHLAGRSRDSEEHRRILPGIREGMAALLGV